MAFAPAFGAPQGQAGGAGSDPNPQMPGPPSDGISCLRFSAAGAQQTMLGCCSWDKTVRVWSLAPNQQGSVTGTALGCHTHTHPVLSMAFSADGKMFFGGCCKTAVQWNPAGAQGQQTQQVAAHDAPISCIRYVDQGAPAQVLVTSGWEGKVRFWDLRQQQPVKEEQYPGPVTHFDIVGDTAVFLTGRQAHFYNLGTMAKVGDLNPPEAVKFQLTRCALMKNKSAVICGTNDGRVVTLRTDGQSDQWKGHGDRWANDQNHFDGYPCNLLLCHPSNNTIISGGSDGFIRFFEQAKKQRFFMLDPVKHNGREIPICNGDLSADGTLFAYGRSYDWNLGKTGNDPNMPKEVRVKVLAQKDVR